MTRTLAIVAIVVASTLAPAHALTSREWQDACESPDLRQQALCATYAAGVFDAMIAKSAPISSSEPMAAIP